MVEVIVFSEYPTEEKFIKQLVAPALRHLEIFVKPQTLNTSARANGGAVTFDRLKFNARNTLLQHPNAVLSTFLDLYALDTDFPEFKRHKDKVDVYDKVNGLQTALHSVVVDSAGCRGTQFPSHIQPYAFEGLLFSDVQALSAVEPTWSKYLSKPRNIRHEFDSPEHINGSYETTPSRRLEDLLRPTYKKTTHGPRAAEHVTLGTIDKECSHFRTWMNSPRRLAS